MTIPPTIRKVISGAVALLATTVVTGDARAQTATIDFETIPGGQPAEGLTISTQFAASHGITFVLEDGNAPVLAERGSPQTAFQGFGFLPDEPAPSAGAGQFFLTDDGIVSGPPSALLIHYQSPTLAASGILLDIDNSEEWTVEAFDAGGNLLDQMVLGPNTPNGSASVWSFNLPTPVITMIRMDYSGNPVSGAGIGLAFDNFSATTAAGSWVDLGGGTQGIAGTPSLVGMGSLIGGTPVNLALTKAPPLAPMLAWISLAPAPFAALGGTVHAFPFSNQILLFADASGTLSETLIWPSGIPSITGVWFQFLIEDLSSIHGITLSNGLRATTP